MRRRGAYIYDTRNVLKGEVRDRGRMKQIGKKRDSLERQRDGQRKRESERENGREGEERDIALEMDKGREGMYM